LKKLRHFLASIAGRKPAEKDNVPVLHSSASAAGYVAGNLITFNDNGAWCWYQDPRAVVDVTNGKIIVGSVAAPEGPNGKKRRGNVEAAIYDITTGVCKVVVLHERLQADDHNAPAFFIRPDGRYLAVYTKHNCEKRAYWRISTRPHDADNWEPEKTFSLAGRIGKSRITYSNLHFLSAEKRLYNFLRGINHDPTIMISVDDGNTFSYAGKLFTKTLIGYSNAYVKYASNGVDRIDLICTEHHPRDFNNSIYHGFIRGGKLHTSDGSVTDGNVFSDQGRSQTHLTRVFAADSVWNGETMTHAWTTDLRLDQEGHPVALITCRANDIPENSNYDDHRFFYARWDGRQWIVHQVAKAGPCLWRKEEDYTGLGSIHPHHPDTLYLSTPIDPRDEAPLAHHEIFKGVTKNGGASWQWMPVTENSGVDNLRPYIPVWDAEHTAVIWFCGTMTASQHYHTAMVGIIE